MVLVHYMRTVETKGIMWLCFEKWLSENDRMELYVHVVKSITFQKAEKRQNKPPETKSKVAKL